MMVLVGSRLLAILVALALFSLMLAMLELGRRIGESRRARGEQISGLGAIEGAVFALMGLLIAFTFSGAAARFDERRHLVVEEANALGTAYLRLGLVPPEAQAKLKEDFRRYLDARLAAYKKLADVSAAEEELGIAHAMQQQIWNQALAAARDSPQALMLLLPALNETFDISTTRTAATQMHPPIVIYGMLLSLALAGSVLAGVGMAASSRSWVHTLSFAAIMTMSIYVIVDMEYPRVGLIRVDAIDSVLIQVREGMK